MPPPKGNPPPDADLRDAAIRPEDSCIVQAPAGSGKTALLVTRFIRLLAGVDKPEQLLAITFTRKAAAEMRRRVIAALDENRLAEQPVREALGPHLEAVRKRNQALDWDLANNPSRLQIKTIDSFAMSLAGRLPLASGFSRRSQPAEDADELYEKAAHKVLNRLFNDDPLSDEIGRFLALNDNKVSRARELLIGMLRRRDQWLDPVREVAGEDGPTAQSALGKGVKRLVDSEVGQIEQRVPASLRAELEWMIRFANRERRQTRLAALTVARRQQPVHDPGGHFSASRSPRVKASLPTAGPTRSGRSMPSPPSRSMCRRNASPDCRGCLSRA